MDNLPYTHPGTTGYPTFAAKFQRTSTYRPSHGRGLLRDSHYRVALKSLPPPGTGCHPKLLSVANLGRSAGHTPDRVFADLRKFIPPGDREITDIEIWDAVAKAFSIQMRTTAGKTAKTSDQAASTHGLRTEARHLHVEHHPATAQPQHVSLEELLHGVPPVDLAELSNRGPAEGGIAIPADIRYHATTMLKSLYAPSEHVFIGTRYDAGAESIMTANEWITRIEATMHSFGSIYEYGAGLCWPHALPNPLTGGWGLAKSGKPSMRCDDTVASHRFVTVEFDTIAKQDQLRVYRALRLRVSALIDSGGKSYHAWIRVDLPDADAWDRVVQQGFFGVLKPLGADGSCCNPSRLSRLPGVARVDKGTMQKLLYLNTMGGVI